MEPSQFPFVEFLYYLEDLRKCTGKILVKMCSSVVGFCSFPTGIVLV